MIGERRPIEQLTEAAPMPEQTDASALDPYSYQAWLEVSNMHRLQLFGNPMRADKDDVSFASLARQTPVKPFAYSEMLRAKVNHSVYAILKAHEALAANPQADQGLFCLMYPDDNFEMLTGVTSGVVYWWERAWHLAHGDEASEPSPFDDLPMTGIDPADFENESVQLVVETAAAVCEAMQWGYRVGSPQTAYAQQVVGFIARYGPDYAASWVRGDIIRAHCQSNGLDEEAYLHLFTKNTRLIVAINYTDHLGTVDRIAHRYFAELDDAHLQTITGWDADRVQAFFPFKLRRKLAYQHLGSDIGQVIRDRLQRFQVALHPARLAERYNWDIERAKAVFIEDLRKDLAFGTEKNMLVAADRIARNLDSPGMQIPAIAKMLGWGKEETARLFTPPILTEICNGRDPRAKVRLVAENFDLVLSTDNLAKHLRISENEVDSCFSEGMRKYLAMCKDPIHNAHVMYANIHAVMRVYSLGRPLACYIVTANPKNPLEAAQAITDRLPDAPPGVSANGWAWAIAMHPRGDAQKWAQQIDAYRLWIYTQDVRSLEGKWQHEDGSSIIDLVADKSAPDPADVVAGTGQEALESLRELAEQAGVSHEQLEELLCRFSDMSAADAEQDATLAGMLEKLRQAAG